MKTRASTRTRPAALAVLALALSVSCMEEPRAVTRHYDLSAATLESLADYPDAQARILGTLEMLFGTPERASFMLTDEWLDDGYDPNWAWYASDDGGSGEIDDERREEILEDNRRRFARQLSLIDEERYDEIGAVRGAPGLNRNWRLLLADRDQFDDFQAEARLLFEDYYPSLADSAELYRLECLHCHGNEGGGDGPTAPFLNPLPRDYRHGIFKFTGVKDKARPRREDLYRILDQGVTGTAMPSFRRFSLAQIEGLVDYVRLLAIRGEVERLLTLNVLDDELITPALVGETYADVWSKWDTAGEKYLAFEGEIPQATPAMLERGRELFNDAATGNCASCHGELGLGDGASAYTENEDGERVSAYNDDWGNPIIPRNLTRGIYRGGRRPIDIYRRIYAGINGTPMPALGDSKDANGDPLLSDDELWSLVHYVRSLSESPDQIGLEVHPIISSGAHGAHAETDSHGASQAEPADEHGR